VRSGGRDQHHHDTTTTSLITLNAEPIAVLAAVSSSSSSSSNPTLVGEMTWTDNYFDEEDDDEHHDDDDIVAVFDYNIKLLKEKQIKELFDPWWLLLPLPIYSFVLLSGLPIVVIIGLSFLCWSTLLLLRIWFSVGNYCTSGLVWPHTAVTRTGVRHIIPPSSTSPEQPGYALDIPFADIVSIELQPLSNLLCLVVLTLASTDHGIEYVTSGYCHLIKNRVGGQTQLVLTALLEPVRFKKLVVAMKDKL
jgi:hypothetical protein